MNLSDAFFHFQSWTNKGHRAAIAALRDYLGWKSGQTILEIGCGAGNVARHFAEENVSYVGLDLDPARVIYAQSRFPKMKFLTADACKPFPNGFKPSHAFCHGLLHHLSDEQALSVLRHAKNVLGPNGNFAAIEDFEGGSAFRMPLVKAGIVLDGGQYIRPLDHWKKLFGPALVESRLIDLWPRWPVPKMAFRIDLSKIA